MGLRLNRLLSDARRLDRGEWSTETASGRIAIGCPACGCVSELPEDREPRKGSDTVHLIWQCEDEACSFADWISLGDWLERAA
jgi:hypothetical protein